MMTNESHDDDDFVLTISDDDGPLPYEEESGEFLAEAPALLANPKRKRAAEEEEEAEGIPASTIGSSKRQKKGKKGKAKEKNKKLGDSGINESADEIGVRKQDEDDGAMNSDFEFDAGDGNTGVVEDFDGWGGDDLAQLSVKEGPKKGVDIDEIIARRRARKTEPTEANGHTNGFQRQSLNKTSNGVKANVVGFEKGVNDVSDDNSEGQDGDADNRAQTEVDMSDDELLAPDGFGMGAADESDVDEEDGAELPEGSDSEEESVASPVPHPDDEVVYEANNDSDDPEEQARREAFFAPEAEGEKSQGKVETLSKSFQAMALSRPILRGLASVGFSDPTPIQAKTIPVALLGKDVVGGAVTGSGKTAAFMIPILERLLYRPKKVPTSRVAILMPTRELAVQCFNVARKLASFTDVTFCQLVGGFSLREQENVLKKRPDVIIATPGRFIDHMRNSASFTLDTLEILVLDEADRMLEDGFADELDEILTTIPKSRQTMLFSATMTSNVDKLIRVGLNRPVRLMVDAQRQTVGTLVQEFVRLRVGKEDKRLAYLMHLCTTIYTERCIVFFRQKKEAHRVRICFGLFGLRAAELHGSMTQEQRITSVESFRSGVVTHLLATDVASRGLDIKGVESVINYEAPQSHEIYLHRVGRTARAGRSGRACTIAAEPDRKVVKATVKAGKAQGAKIVSRIVEPPVVDAWIEKIEAVETEVAEILEEEKEERALGQVEMRVRKGENMMEHEAEIMARPKRTWFESEADKKAAKLKGRAELNGPDGGESRGLKRTAGKLSGKDKKKLDDRRDRKEGRTWKKGREEKEAGPRTGKGSKPKSAGKGKTNSKERGGKMKATFKVKSKSKNKARR